jgi:hypothetical protein
MQKNNKRAGDSIKIHFSAQYVKPKIEENKFKNWVMNGKNNEYFLYVNDRYLGSPTNAAIINNYCKLIYGLGLQDKGGIDLSEYIDKKEIKKFTFDFYSQGMAYWQVIYNRDKTINEIAHIEVDKIAPEIENKEGEIEGYWFCKDWTKQIEFPPERYAAFGKGESGETEIFAVRPYKLGQDYFATPSYQAGLQYAEMEEEISNFCINHIKRGFSGGYIIHVPNSSSLSETEKDDLEIKIRQRLTGSSMAGSFVLDFAVGDEKITVQVVEVNTSHKQWEVLREQAKEQIITAHEVVSPMLFGVRTATGFSNNADELEEAEAQTRKRVIRPIQEEITDSLESIFLAKDIETDLFFLGLSEEEEQAPETTGADIIEVEAHAHPKAPENLDTELADGLIGLGEAEDLETWRIIDQGEVTNPDEEIEIKFASTGTAIPNANSEQDSDDIIIRYEYSPQKVTANSREFCKKMVTANKIYRKEDILRMEGQSVNPGFGASGSDNYSIWLYKGGARCSHKWFRKIYVRRGSNFDVNNPNIQIISTTKARSAGYNVPTNENEVSIAPRNMDYEGFTPEYYARTFLSKIKKLWS